MDWCDRGLLVVNRSIVRGSVRVNRARLGPFLVSVGLVMPRASGDGRPSLRPSSDGSPVMAMFRHPVDFRRDDSN